MTSNDASLFATASEWLMRMDAPVRETVLRHWVHYKLSDGQSIEAMNVTSQEQIGLIQKALSEHHAVLLPDFLATIGVPFAAPSPAKLSLPQRQVLDDDDDVLRAHSSLRVVSTQGGMGRVILEAPHAMQDKERIDTYIKGLFPHAEFTRSEQPIDGSYRIEMRMYDFKLGVDGLKRPLGYRTLPDQNAVGRVALEEEYRLLTHAPARAKEREMDALVQELGMTKALHELTRDTRLMFSDNLQDGVYRIAVKDENSLIVKGARALIDGKTFSPNDAALFKGTQGLMLAITPAAMELLNDALFHGIGKLPSLLSPVSANMRANYFSGLRVDAARYELVQSEIATMGDDERKAVDAMLGNASAEALLPQAQSGNRVGLEVLSRAVEKVASKHDSMGDAYDVRALRLAIARGVAMLKEDGFWKHLDHSQLASHHNSIREDSIEALGDLDRLLAAQPFSQRSLGMLVNQGRFADAIRSTGHFMTIVQDANSKGFDNGATQYQQAFHLTRAALEPQTSEAKAASYYLRAGIGKVGTGEVIKRNVFMGLRPIISSVDLAVKKPLLCGAVILGIGAYSAAVPPKYSIPRLLINLMEKTMEAFGIAHGNNEKELKKLKRNVEHALEEMKKTGGDKDYWKGFGAGSKFGVAKTTAAGMGLFMLFNFVEDFIVHVPLALVSVGVGAAGGATGRKVISPVFNDIGDLVGRYSPEPVREAYRADMALLRQAGETHVGRIGHAFAQTARDVDEFGIVATAHHAMDSTSRNFAALYHKVMGTQAALGR